MKKFLSILLIQSFLTLPLPGSYCSNERHRPKCTDCEGCYVVWCGRKCTCKRYDRTVKITYKDAKTIKDEHDLAYSKEVSNDLY